MTILGSRTEQMTYRIYWPDLDDYSGHEWDTIQEAIAWGEACGSPFVVEGGEPWPHCVVVEWLPVVKCSWCGKRVSGPAHLELVEWVRRVSHTICKDCLAIEVSKI